jgi:hypothetical protein
MQNPAGGVRLGQRLGFRLQNAGYVNPGGPGQAFGTLHHLEAVPYWVRLIWFNDQPVTWTLDGAAIAPTAEIGNGVDAVNAAGFPDTGLWQRVTFACEGQDSEPVPTKRSERYTFEVPASQHGPARPTLVFSDWMRLPGMPRRDGAIGALLLVRSYSQWLMRYSGAFGLPDPAIGRDHRASWTKGEVTKAPWHERKWNPFDGAFASYGLQYISDVPGATMVGIGDSITHGMASAGGLSGFGFRAAAMVSTPERPVSYVNEGFIGRKSDDYAAAGAWAIKTFTPQVTLIQAWSENDPWTFEAAERAFASAIALADMTRRAGGVPILMTAAPVFVEHPEAEPARQTSNAAVRNLGAKGWPVLDLDALWGTGASPNAYRPEYDSGDKTHQTDAACVAAAEPLAAMLREILNGAA